MGSWWFGSGSWWLVVVRGGLWWFVVVSLKFSITRFSIKSHGLNGDFVVVRGGSWWFIVKVVHVSSGSLKFSSLHGSSINTMVRSWFPNGFVRIQKPTVHGSSWFVMVRQLILVRDVLFAKTRRRSCDPLSRIRVIHYRLLIFPNERVNPEKSEILPSQ